MQQVFVELFSYKESWRQLAPAERKEFADAVAAAVQLQSDDGIEIITWSFNDAQTDRRAPYDFVCVYKTASVQRQRSFEAEIEASGWYRYFDQVNASGGVGEPADLLQAFVQCALGEVSSSQSA